jgi:hypothetical protein
VTFSAVWSRRLRVALALLVLVPTLLLATGGGEARAATWVTIGSGWATGKAPDIRVETTTKAKPRQLRFQVVNQATTRRTFSVFWDRWCDKGSDYSTRSGFYDVSIARGATHTKTVGVPPGQDSCDLDVWVYPETGGKLTLRLQATY